MGASSRRSTRMPSFFPACGWPPPGPVPGPGGGGHQARLAIPRRPGRAKGTSDHLVVVAAYYDPGTGGFLTTARAPFSQDHLFPRDVALGGRDLHRSESDRSVPQAAHPQRPE